MIAISFRAAFLIIWLLFGMAHIPTDAKVKPKHVAENPFDPSTWKPSPKPPPSKVITTGTIQERCLARWDDSHQLHSYEAPSWDYPAGRTQMKKLEHCIRLVVKGPIDIEGVAKQYVDICVNEGLNDERTVYLLKAVAAAVCELTGACAGAGLSALVTDYLSNVRKVTVKCLTDSKRITSYLGGKLGNQMNATVNEDSHWIYWYV